MSDKPVGLTRTAGYQIGVRRTLPGSPERIWRFLFSPAGLRIWLGDLPQLDLEPKRMYRTGDGTTGELRVVKPPVQIRLTWQPDGWAKASTVQIRLLADQDGGRTTVAFHQEQLDGPQARERMRQRWEAALDRIAEELAEGAL